MHNLAAITALGGTEPRVDTVAGVTLSENPNLALASVAARLGQEDVCRDTLRDVLHNDAPEPGKCTLNDPLSALWMGPDQWMISAPFDTHEDLATQVKTRLGDSASVTEQTDAWAAFDVRGDGMQAVMELCCNVNIRALHIGDVQRTAIHHLGCFVQCCGDNWVRIIGPRASAGSLHHAVSTAMHAAL